MRYIPLTPKTHKKPQRNPTTLQKNKKQPPTKNHTKTEFLFSHVPLLPSNNAIQHNIYAIKYLISSMLWFCCASCFKTVLLHRKLNPVGCPGSWLRGRVDGWLFPVKIPRIGNPELRCFISDSKADISQVLPQTKNRDVWPWMFFPLFSTRHVSKLKCQSISNHGCVLAKRE